MSACAPEPEVPPDIILISLDTLRRDHVGAFEPSSPAATPVLDEIANECVVFDSAWAQIPFTLPSHMSMFTGVHPDAHGVDRKKARLADGVPTLGTLLASAGYEGIGVVTNLWMKGEFGFDRGFDHYERVPFGLVYADRVNRRVAELLDRRQRPDSPLFLFVHYIDPDSDFLRKGHNALPYYAPPEFLEGMDIAATDREFCDEQDRCATEFLTTADREQRPLEQETLDRIAALYARGVEYMDEQVAVLRYELEVRGLWDDSLVVITSDHGEEFREHGRFLHIQPYVESLAIPLMVRRPRAEGAGTRVDSIVETVDYLPTLLEAAGVPPPAHVQGTSLVPLMNGESAPARTTFGRDKLDLKRYSLRDEAHTLVHHVKSGSSELYDRASDPAESLDLSSDRPEFVARMTAELIAMVARSAELAELLAAAEVEEGLLSDEEAEQLRAIGYLE